MSSRYSIDAPQPRINTEELRVMTDEYLRRENAKNRAVELITQAHQIYERLEKATTIEREEELSQKLELAMAEATGSVAFYQSLQ